MISNHSNFSKKILKDVTNEGSSLMNMGTQEDSNCLKNERHLSVDSSKKNFKKIMESDPPLSKEGQKVFATIEEYLSGNMYWEF